MASILAKWTGKPMTRDSDPGSDALSLLSLCDLFSHIDTSALGASELEVLRAEVAIVHLRRGEILLRQGDSADCMYAVIQGRLHAFVGGAEGEPNLVGELRAGETVGELGLIDGSPRMATVTAVRDSKLVRVSAAGFDRLVRFNPDSLTKVARAEAERMRSMGQRRLPVTAVRTITVMGAGIGAGFERFAAALCTALAEIGSVLHLSRPRFEALYQKAFEAQEGISGWLSELEDQYQFVVCQADQELSPWTMYCLRQADRIFAVSDAADSPRLLAAEQAALDECKAGRIAAMELVLLHQTDGPVFPGASQWLAPRTVLRHHHVRLNVPVDIGRVVRLLTGRSVGVTLGGGGARGFAHIGVLRAMEEAGIPIDMICGVSMGAIIAALYAMGRQWEDLIRLAKREINRKMTSDVTLPIVALSSGRKFRRVLDTFFGTTAIEDLGIHFFCTSCNLSTSEIVIHRTGSLANAVHASNAIPVVLPPVLSGGQMLIDGGVLNNQPGDILKKLCGGQVIVINVSPRREVTVDSSLAEMPSAWRILRSRINPFEAAIKVPGISVTMMRTLMVASERKSREVERMADFYLRPPIDRFRLDDFTRVEEIAEAGYEYTRQQISIWKANGFRTGTSS
jgi:NTE family protein